MEQRPEKEKYKPLISAIVISVIAGLVLLLGAFCIFVAITAIGFNEQIRVWVAVGGIALLIVSAGMFIIPSIAQDLHYQSYLQDYIADETAYYHTQTMRMMQNMEYMLQQQTYPQQPQPYTDNPASNMPPPQYAPQQQMVVTEQVPQSESISRAPWPQRPGREFEQNARKDEFEQSDESENENEIQFVPKSPLKKKTAVLKNFRMDDAEE